MIDGNQERIAKIDVILEWLKLRRNELNWFEALKQEVDFFDREIELMESKRYKLVLEQHAEAQRKLAKWTAKMERV